MSGGVLITFPIAPRTKKNSQRIARRRSGQPFILPSATSSTFAAKCLAYWLTTFAPPRLAFPRDVLLNCEAHFYRDGRGRAGDAVGYYQALADVLEMLTIVVDDAQLVSWDGSRIWPVDPDPRIEVTLTPIVE